MTPAPLVLLLVVAALTAGGTGEPRAKVRAETSMTAQDTPPPAPAAPGVPEPPLRLAVLAQLGNTVTLGWTPPPSGPAPTGYVLEGGFHPGEVLGSLPLGAAPALTLEAPAGVFYIRLHAIASAERSAASNEVQVFVKVPAPPSAPANLLGLVDGSTVTLSWTNTLAGGAPTELWLEVGGSSAALLPLSMSETFTYAGVPSGSYTLRVRAANTSGTSAPSNTVALTFPGDCSGPPGRPTDFQSWTANGKLHVSWQPPAGGSAVSSYVVSVSGTYGGTVETAARTVSGALPPGAYAVSVAARNVCGNGPAAPAAPDWTAVVRKAGTHVVHWAPTPGANGYRVYWSTNRQALDSLDATASFVEAATSPVSLPVADNTAPIYYRVYDMHGPVAGNGGPVAMATTFDLIDYPVWPGSLTPSLWDLDGDGCLDIVGARGQCDGTFQPYSLETIGLESLTADGRNFVNRDSRFADFTGDGVADVFTNVYTRADDPAFAAILHVGDGFGHFTEDPDMAAMQIRGFGETVLAADFDNDGDLDIFIPHYSHLDDGGHNWLLVNDGAGHFVDVAASAGVATNRTQPEGARALDVNEDGWIDIHVASSLYLNNGDMTFTDQAEARGMPILFDEGLNLFDVDLDGDFDLVHHDAHVTRLFTNVGGTFDAGEAVARTADASTFGFGLNVCDINGDGFEDVVVANNAIVGGVGEPHLLLNVGGALHRSTFVAAPAAYNDLIACADVDNSGLPDVVARWGGYRSAVNKGTGKAVRLRIVGDTGARNQQGRTVRIRPLNGPDKTLLRVVESGSGLMAQNGYDLLVATPWPGDYEVSVRFATGWVRTTAKAGDALTIYASGTVAPGLH